LLYNTAHQNSIMNNNFISSNPPQYFHKLNGSNNPVNTPRYGASGAATPIPMINNINNLPSANFTSPHNPPELNNFTPDQPDDKLNHFLPTDPTAQKNFLDNIQLLNQLSSIAPLDDISEQTPMTSNVQIPPQSSNVNVVGYPNVNKAPHMMPGNSNFKHSNFHANDVYLNGSHINHHPMKPTPPPPQQQMPQQQQIDAQSLTNEQILEVAKLLLGSSTSPLDISLSEVQVMLKRAALQDPYAKHWLIRNFGEQNSKIQIHQPDLLVFKYLALCSNNQQETPNFQTPFQHHQQAPASSSMLSHQMMNRGNQQHLKMPFDNGVNNANDMHHNIENMKRINKAPLNGSTIAPRSDLRLNLPINNSSHIIGNSTDNYRITTLSNGGFMTSKNCANFEKLTMHSSKDLPSHIAHHLVNQGSSFNDRFQSNEMKTQLQDLNIPLENNYVQNSFDLASKLPTLSSNDMLTLQAQNIPTDILNSGKLIPELVAAAAYHQKISPELMHAGLQNSLHSNFDLNGVRSKVSPFGGRHGLPNEYLRSLPPQELLQFQNNFLPYRQLGSVSPIIYSLLQRIEDCYDQFRQVERQRKKTEAELARCFPGRRVSSSNTISLPRLPHNPTRLDRLVLDHMREHARVITLVSKMERLRSTPLHSGIHNSLSVWHSTLTQLTALRNADLINLLLNNNSSNSLNSSGLNVPPALHISSVSAQAAKTELVLSDDMLSSSTPSLHSEDNKSGSDKEASPPPGLLCRYLTYQNCSSGFVNFIFLPIYC